MMINKNNKNKIFKLRPAIIVWYKSNVINYIKSNFKLSYFRKI